MKFVLNECLMYQSINANWLACSNTLDFVQFDLKFNSRENSSSLQQTTTKNAQGYDSSSSNINSQSIADLKCYCKVLEFMLRFPFPLLLRKLQVIVGAAVGLESGY